MATTNHARSGPAWLLGIAVALPVWAVGLAAQPGYPNRPVRIIVPYGPGGVADTAMRIIADKLTQKLGQQLIVDNRLGAGGIVAAKAAAGAAPDGYVLHLTGNGTAISTALFRQLPSDVLRDFTPITITAWFDLIIATRASGPLQTVADILKAARQNPGKLNFQPRRKRRPDPARGEGEGHAQRHGRSGHDA
jgi:tripartite-type tricarboxylate transporter receptor subunit TctC